MLCPRAPFARAPDGRRAPVPPRAPLPLAVASGTNAVESAALAAGDNWWIPRSADRTSGGLHRIPHRLAVSSVCDRCVCDHGFDPSSELVYPVGGDTVLRLLSFLAMFAPASLAWSVDAMLGGEQGIQHVVPLIRPIGHLLPLGEGEGTVTTRSAAEGTVTMRSAQMGPSYEGTAFPVFDVWPLRLMQILISIVYLRTVFWKLRGKMWWNGTAAWYPVWVDTYLRNPRLAGC